MSWKGQKATRRIERILAAVHKPRNDKPEWWDDLLLNKDGDPRDCIANVALALRSEVDFAGRLRFDQLLNAAACLDMPWRPGGDWRRWTDLDDIALTERLQLLGLPVRKATVADAVALVAGESPHHPVAEWLDGLSWDGTKRLDTWLSTCLGVADTPYSRAVGRATLIAGKRAGDADAEAGLTMRNIIPYRHPIHDTLAALDAALAAGAVKDPVAANWLGQMAAGTRGLLAEMQRLGDDAGRWRASAARMAAQQVPMEAMRQTVQATREAMAGMVQCAAAADRESFDLEGMKRATAMLAVGVDNLLELVEGLALGYEHMRAKLAAGAGR